MIGRVTEYRVELLDDVWSQVFVTEDIDEARYYMDTRRGKGTRYRLVKASKEVIYAVS